MDKFNHFITTREAASLLGLSEGTLNKWRYKNFYDLAFVKMGKAVRYRLSDIEAFIAKKRNTRSNKTAQPQQH